MSKKSTAHCIAALAALAVATGLLSNTAVAQAPASFASQTAKFNVKESYHRLEIIATTSKLLTMEFEVPRMAVDNPEVVQVQPLSPNQIQLSARKPGVTNLKLWDKNGKVYLVDVVVYGDARELENLLISEFPQASLRVRPLASSVVISGFVPSANMVSQIISVAEDYYPKVINKIEVGGAQQILLHVKVMEVSRTKLRKLGFDWALFNGDDAFVSRPSGLISSYSLTGGTVVSNGGETLAVGLMNSSTSFFGFLEALRQNNLAKVLAEPTLVTVSGRPASFQSGGEIPILVPQGLQTFSIEYKEIGTRVDFVPIILGNGHIRLEVRPNVSELDPARSVTIQNTTIPGIRNRWVDTGAEMRAGQTLALAGLVQNRIEAENKGLPYLADLPWVGNLFRRVEETQNEIELVITVTPQFAAAMDPNEVPPCGPGGFTRAPDEVEFYGRGYLEVPKCCFDGSCPSCLNGHGGGLHGLPSPAQGGMLPPPGAGAPSGVLPNGAAPNGAILNGSGAPAGVAPGAIPNGAVPGNGDPVEPPRVQQIPLESDAPASDDPGTTNLQNPLGGAADGGAPVRRRIESGLIGPQGYDFVR